VLIIALVALPLAALFFGMTASDIGGPGGSDTALPSLALVFSLLAIRFRWARVTSVAMLAFLTIQWLPGAFAFLGDPRVGQAPIYVLIGTVLFVAGAVLAFLVPSNDYYRESIVVRSRRSGPRRR